MTYTTLRDQLAMAALTALIHERPDANIYEVCHAAYSYADAMLSIRERESGLENCDTPGQRGCQHCPACQKWTEETIDRQMEREG